MSIDKLEIFIKGAVKQPLLIIFAGKTGKGYCKQRIRNFSENKI